MKQIFSMILFVAMFTHVLAAPPAETSALLDYEKNTISIFQKNSQSVVNVHNMKVARPLFGNPVEIKAGSGSGWVWDSQGHIVTNFHVAAAGKFFLITFHNDEKQYKANLVGGYPQRDIAVLKLEEVPKNIVPVELGNSRTLLAGQKAIAIGNPFGLDTSISAGIISATNRSVEGYSGLKIPEMIQTDAAINPGNSGGPLLDSQGKVIGMNTQIVSAAGSSAGVGFAVPIDIIKRVVPQLIKHGKVIRPGIGVRVTPLESGPGLMILEIQDGGAAAQAGLKSAKADQFGRIYYGDILIEIDGKKIESYDDLFSYLENKNIGDEVHITYLRNNKKQKATLKLGQAD